MRKPTLRRAAADPDTPRPDEDGDSHAQLGDRRRTKPSELLRFVRAPSFLRIHLMQRTGGYWHLRAAAKRISFYVSRSLWLVRRAGRSTQEQVSLTLAIARAILFPLVGSLLLVFALGFGDRQLGRWPALARHIPSAPSAEIFLTVATALAGIGGAFLGLYFTAISVVASTSYRDVPDDVRVAALQERTGIFYLQMVSVLTAIGIVMSSALAFEVNPGRLNFVFLGCLGVTSIFSFLPLGQRAFSFLDPVRLADSLGRDVLDAASLAGSKRHYCENPSFQAAYQRNAERAIGTLENVVSVSLREAHSDSISLRRVASHVLVLIALYVQKKRAIPVDSLWFPRRPEFRSWLTADGAYLETALRTGTQIQPKAVPSRHWLEQRLAATVSQIVTELFHKGEYDAASAVVQTALKVIEQLTYAHRFHEAHILSRSVATLKLEPQTGQSAAQRLSRRSAFDMTRRAAICVTIGLGRSAEEASSDLIRALVTGAHGSRRLPAALDPPDAVQEKISFLRRSAAFELAAEQREVTPDWFTHHFVAGAFLDHLFRCVATLLGDLRVDYVEGAARLVGEDPIEAVQLVQTGLEACHKLAHHAMLVAHVAEAVRSLERPIAEHDWPSANAEVTAASIQNLCDELVATLAQIVPTLPHDFDAEGSPDDFGYVYVTLAEETLRRMLRVGHEIATIFPAYFVAALGAYQRVGQELAALPQQTRVALASDILADLCDISGYALVLNDLGVPGPWEVVQATWDRYLGQHAKPDELLRLVMASLAFLDGLFAITPRTVIRTGWQRIFLDRLADLGLAAKRSYWDDRLDSGAGGPIARAFLRGSLERAHDVFATCYLANQPAFAGIELPRAASNFQRSLEAETRRRAANEDAGSGEDAGKSDDTGDGDDDR